MTQRFSNEQTTYAPKGMYRIRNQSNGTWLPWVEHNGPYPLKIVRGSAWGLNNPRYRSLVRQKAIIPMTAYSRFDSDVDPRFFAVEYRDTTLKYNPTRETDLYEQCRYADVPIDLFTVVPKSDLGQYLVQAAASKAYTKGWDGLTFFAEIRKTWNMVFGLAQNLRNLMNRIERLLMQRRSDMTFAGLLALKAKQARDLRLEDIWLEARYGWRILIYDIKDASEALSRLGKERTRVRTKEDELDSYSTTSTVVSQWGDQGTVTNTVTTSYNVSTIGRIVADFSPPSVRMNPVLTAWELVKFSWVVDWFFHVAQWLEALSFLTMQTRMTSAWSCMVSITTQVSLPTFMPNGPRSISMTSSSGSGISTGVYLTRVPCGVPLLPQWHVELNLGRYVDALALLFQQTRKR